MIRHALLLALIAAPVAAQKTFEGAVSITVTADNGKTMPLNYLVKDGKMRMDQTSARGTMGIIIDPATQKMLMIMDAQKMYMEMDMAKGAAAVKKEVGDKRMEVTRTGKTETIAGYSCEHVTLTDDDGASTDACVTTELGQFRLPMGGGSPMQPPREPGWSSKLAANSFPLKVQKGDKVIMEVTKIEKKSLDAALFAPPAGYNKFDMPAMPKRPGTH